MTAFPPPQLPPPDPPAPIAPATWEPVPTAGATAPSAPASAAPTPRRRPWPLIGAVAALVLVVGGVMIVRSGGGDDDPVGSSGTSLAWEEAWRTRLTDLSFEPDAATLASVVWADTELAAILVGGEDDDGETAAALAVLDPGSGEVRWTTDVAARFGLPTVFRSGDVLVVIDSEDGSFGSREARAFDIESGDRLWRERDAGVLVLPVGDRIVMNRQHDPSEDVIADLLVLDAATGDTVFERVPDEGVVSLHAVRSDGLVVVETSEDGPHLIGLSFDGDERWSRPVTFGLDTAPDVRLDLAGGTTVVVDDDEMLGLDVASGDERWSVDVVPDDDAVVVPTSTNDAVVVCREDDDAVEIRVHDLSTGSERWTRTFDGDGAGFLGVSRGDVVLGEVSVGVGCSVRSAPFATSVELVDVATGDTSWRVTDDDGRIGDLELRWATVQEQIGAGLPAFLTSVRMLRDGDSGPDVDTLLDPVTGAEIVVSTDEEDWQYSGLGVYDGAPVAFALVDDEMVVFDPADHTRRITTDRGRLLGAGGDVLYVLDGDTVVAVR